jgi:alanyl-tRNA synthetase
MADLGGVVIDIMGEAYPHIVGQRDAILAAVDREEAQFARTLDAGSRLLEDALRDIVGPDAPRVIGRRPETLPDDAPKLPGEVAFRLHDTFGFPIDLTIELAAEYGVAVDREGFDAALAEQRDRSRSGKKAELAKHAELSALYQAIQARAGDTTFLGYETTTAEGRVVAIVRDGMEFDELTGQGAAEVVLDRTPFYAEGGGQVGDRGELREAGGGSSLFAVEDTQKPVGGLIVLRGTLHGRLRVGETVEEVLRSDLALEGEAIPPLRDAIAHCEEVRDYVTRDLFRRILDNEEEHVDFLERQFDMIERMGIQNYIQLQSRPAPES